MARRGIRVVFRHRSRGVDQMFELGPDELGGLDVGSLMSTEAGTAKLQEAITRTIRQHGGGFPEGSFDEVEVHLQQVDKATDMTLTRRTIPALDDAGDEAAPDPALDRVSRCRSFLQVANFVLPPSVREDALDEWMDEIQCAAEEGLPFRRRALSILCRSLPALAVRARLPVRARRGESRSS